METAKFIKPFKHWLEVVFRVIAPNGTWKHLCWISSDVAKGSAQNMKRIAFLFYGCVQNRRLCPPQPRSPGSL